MEVAGGDRRHGRAGGGGMRVREGDGVGGPGCGGMDHNRRRGARVRAKLSWAQVGRGTGEWGFGRG